MKKVLVTVTNYSKYCLEGKRILEDYGCEIIENPHGRPCTAEELKEIVGSIDGVVAGVDTWDEEIFAKAPRLLGIARFGVGVDNIDLEAAKKRGIIVCNSPGINTTAVAEQAVGLMLSLTRQIPVLNAAVRKGSWLRPMSHELKSRTIGFLGFGAIARDVSEKLQGFHPRMIAYDKYPDKEAAEKLGVSLVSLEEVLKESDLISIHLPATQETEKLINADTIRLMKDGVLLINTARGSIVDEQALCGALTSGKIAGMGTDVFAAEPVLPDHPLFAFEQYLATPHTSAETYENCAATSQVTARALIDIFEGRAPQFRLV